MPRSMHLAMACLLLLGAGCSLILDPDEQGRACDPAGICPPASPGATPASTPQSSPTPEASPSPDPTRAPSPEPTPAATPMASPDPTRVSTPSAIPDPTSTPAPSPRCGDGNVDDGETCDGNCPVSCDDRDACTDDQRVGQAFDCDVVCRNPRRIACLDGDGCCPDGCDGASDDDCGSRCGNGVLEPGEDCDDGDAGNSDSRPDACRRDCGHPFCGDGVVDSGEICDEGDENSDAPGRRCNLRCALNTCGDGICDVLRGDAQNCPADCSVSSECHASSPTGTCFVQVPPGVYWRGATPDDLDADDDERPRHQVTLTRALLVQTTEVTRELWNEVMAVDTSHHRCERCPAEDMDWEEALAFANALSEREGLPTCFDLSRCTGTIGTNFDCTFPVDRSSILDCEGYRLPAEAEWEYFARAGVETPRYGRLADIAWHSNFDTTHAVGGKAPNAWGLYDVLGNVSEWCLEPLGNYPGSAQIDPVGVSGSGRVQRGGSTGSFDEAARLSARGTNGGTHGYSFTGFRLVRTAP